MKRATARSWIPVLVAAALAVPCGSALAATQGSLGNISVASSQVSIIVGDTAQASGIDDIVLAPWSEGSPAPIGTTQACIYSSTGSYQVTATSSNAASNRFRLASGTNFLRYTVRWNDGVSGLTSVTTGTPLASLVADSSSPDCSGGKPASVEVRIPNAAISAAPIGNYADTLTIMITPQ
jgi:hypothetical protein